MGVMTAIDLLLKRNTELGDVVTGDRSSPGPLSTSRS